MKKPTEQDMQEGIAWLRARPKCLHELMMRYPPSCKVRALCDLHVPGPGKIGQLVSYVEDKSGKNEHMLRVVELPNGHIAAECKPEWLEVVEYWEYATPEFVKNALTGL